jgi:hypothetical protein
LEEHVFSICRVEEQAKQETSMKQEGSRAMLKVTCSSKTLVDIQLTTEHIPQKIELRINTE